MAAPISTPLPPAPSRSEGEAVFVPKANAFLGALEPFRVDLQAQADYVTGVLTIAAEIGAVDAIAAEVVTVAGIAPDVTAVANNAVDISAVNANAVDISVVAATAVDISGVALIAADVTAVNANSVNINAVKANSANIDTVANDSAAINTLAPISADITAAVPLASDLVSTAAIGRRNALFARSLAVKPPVAGETLRLDYTGQSFALGDKAVGLLDTLQDFKTAHAFTRSSAGSTINAMREIVSVPANEPRFTHDILTGEPQGLLVEEQRTRLNTVSLLPTAAETITVTAVAHTVSFYGTGKITISGTHSAVLQGTGEGRVTLTFTPTAGALTLTPTGSVKHLQLEAGADATSVILGEGSAVTRSADSVTYTVGAEYNTTEGTLIVKITGRNSAFLEGLGHYNAIVSGTGTYVFRYNATDAWVHAPNSDTLRYGRQQLGNTLLTIARAGMARMKDVVYIPRDVGAGHADSIKAGDAVFVYDIGSAHYARASFLDFYREKSISLIPAGLFDNTPLVTIFNATFRGNQLTSIPEGLFDNTPLAANFYQTFRDNQITSIPAGLFDNTPLVINFYQTFYNNQLTSIPAGLFDNTPLVATFNNTFLINQITSIPAGLFDAQTVCTNYDRCFENNQLTQQSVDNVLVSIAYSASTNSLSGGTLGLTGGTNATPSATGLAAKATLVGLGWTVLHN